MFPQLGMSKNRQIASLLTRFFQQMVFKKKKRGKITKFTPFTVLHQPVMLHQF